MAPTAYLKVTTKAFDGTDGDLSERMNMESRNLGAVYTAILSRVSYKPSSLSTLF